MDWQHQGRSHPSPPRNLSLWANVKASTVRYLIWFRLARVSQFVCCPDYLVSIDLFEESCRFIMEGVDGLHPLRFLLPIGQQAPLPVGAGKVLAAALSDEELRRLPDERG